MYKLENLLCPECHSELSLHNDLICINCKAVYNIENGIPILLTKNFMANQFGMDYHEHYKIDNDFYDYFEERICMATAHDERRVREYIVSLIPNTAKNILDIGSGGAWAAMELCKKGFEVCSFDITFHNISKALTMVPDDNHSGVVGDALNPPFKNETFDCIIASEIIEHLVEPKEFVKNIIPLLKKDGVLIISTPYKEKIQYSICVHCNTPTPHNAHLHSFDENSLTAAFGEQRNNCQNYIFGNKALTIARTHVLLQFLPLSIWKAADKLANLLINKPAHIICKYININSQN